MTIGIPAAPCVPARFRAAPWLRRLAGVLVLCSAPLLGQEFEIYRQLVWEFGGAGEKLTLGPGGELYGTSNGGEFGRGQIFRLIPAGGGAFSYERLYSFHGPDGAEPSGVVQGADGRFYGATWSGGAFGGGTVYAFDPVTRGVVVIHSFPIHSFYGRYLPTRLVAASDGNLYGATLVGGAPGFGTIYRVTTAGEFTNLHDFTPPEGERPNVLMQASDGNLYGTASFGGAGVGLTEGLGYSGGGTIFRSDLSGNVTAIYSFPETNNFLVGDLVEAPDGDLYGTSFTSGSFHTGSAFRCDKAGNATLLHSFPSAPGEGFYATGGLTLAPDGFFYGITAGGGDADSGTVFRMSSDGTVTTLVSFPGPYPTGVAQPCCGLTRLNDGSLVGVTQSGGGGFTGVAFRMPVPGSAYDVIHVYGGPAPVANPAADLVQTADGTLWGTAGGGASGLGTVFRLSGGPLLVHEFSGGDGANPGNLFAAPDGNLYGVTASQGAGGSGTIFRIDGSGAFTTLHTFSGPDGSEPAGGLMQASDGNFYGTTAFGGADGGGTLFRLTSAGTHTKLHDFTANAIPEEPRGRILQASDGMLYFTGIGIRGALFRSDLDGNVVDIHDFFVPEGERPPAGVIEADDGNLYGTTRGRGGDESLGTVFRFGLPSTYEVVHTFTGSGRTLGGVIEGSDGRLYGTTTGEFASVGLNGGVFGVDRSGANFAMVREFSGFDGASPKAGLMRASDGMLYGTTQGGGVSGFGLVFRVDLASSPPSIEDIAAASGPASGGVAVTIRGQHFRPGAAATLDQVPVAMEEGFDQQIHFAITPTLTPGTLYDVTVTNTDGQSATLPQAFFADFLDAPSGSLFHDSIEAIFRDGITAGCGTGSYCGGAAVTRGQIAVFLLKVLQGSTYVPPPCTGVFPDVPCPSMFADWIEELSAEGISAGCGGGLYCPQGSVPRDHAAVLLLKTEHGTDYVPPVCAGIFADVPCPSPYADWIEQLTAEEIAAGCGTDIYCPRSPATRGQMAVFLEKVPVAP